MILLYLKGREKCGENGAEQARTKGSRNGGHGQIVWGPIEFRFYFECSESYWRDIKRRMS